MGSITPQEKFSKDIGSLLVSDVAPLGHLKSSKKQELLKVYHVIGHNTVKNRELDFAPHGCVDSQCLRS